MTIEFTVPGRPVPMARPRVTMHGTYTPKRCREYKDIVQLFARQAMRHKEPLECAVRIDIVLWFGIPKSYEKGKRLAAEYNVIKPIGRNTGDADNHAKGIMDALKGICWSDDSQVTRMTVYKRYGQNECAMVKITEDKTNGDKVPS